MSATNPPDPNVNTFNNLYWISRDTTLTQDVADKRYLRFPTAQGTENLAAINVAGIAGFNNEIVQTGATNNIVQDLTLIGNQNLLKATDIYGDLDLRRPTAGLANGGGLRLWDVTNNTSGFSSQIFTSGTAMGLVNLNNGGTTIITTTDGAGVKSQPLQINSTAINSNVLLNANSDLNVKSVIDIQDNTNPTTQHTTLTTLGNSFTTNTIGTTPTAAMAINGINYLTYIGNTGDLQLIGTNATFTTTNPPTCSAVQPVSSDSSTKIPTTAWTQGAIDAKIPASLLGSNNTWTGTNDFVNLGTGSLTSSAVQPVASDSSTKVPTTAWVQTAIAAAPAPPLSADLTPNSVSIVPTTSPPNLACGVKNYYNEGAIVAVDAFVPYQDTGSKQVKQYFARLVFNTARNLGGGGNTTIYQNSQVRTTLSLTNNNNVQYWGTTYGVQNYYSTAVIALNYNYQDYYNININTKDNSSQGVSFILKNTGSNNNGGFSGIIPDIWVEKTAGQNWYNFYFLNGPFSSGGSSGFVTNWQASFTIELLNGGQSVNDTSSVWLEEYVVAVNV